MPLDDDTEFKFPDEVESKGKPAQNAEPEIEIEIEDDAPAEDRGRQPLPKPLVEELEKDELDQYDDNVKTKLKQMRAHPSFSFDRPFAEIFPRELLVDAHGRHDRIRALYAARERGRFHSGCGVDSVAEKAVARLHSRQHDAYSKRRATRDHSGQRTTCGFGEICGGPFSPRPHPNMPALHYIASHRCDDQAKRTPQSVV